MIEPIEKLPEAPRFMGDERREGLNRDVREIIEKRIPYCEIKDTGYANSSLPDAIKKSFRIVTGRMCREMDLARYVDAYALFRIVTRGKIPERRIFVEYYPEEMDKQIARCRGEGK